VPRGGTAFFEADLRQPTALLLGGEGQGLPPGLAADADERVTIPMTPPVESLNVAVATALITYEARRQRG
jgi:TrmH family RNA methyltransferase